MSSSTSKRLQLVTLLILPLTAVFAMEPCPSFCRYRLCSLLYRVGSNVQPENRQLSTGFPGSPLGPYPCIQRKSGAVHAVRNVTGVEALVARQYSDDDFVPISKFLREEGSSRFPKTFFSWIGDPETRQSTLARKAFEGNQRVLLDNTCVQMPITSFLKRNKDGSMTRVMTKGRRACVGFRPVVSKLLVLFEWSSSNDFDLLLTEPNGFEINRLPPYRESPNGGRLPSDNGRRTCQVDNGRESIIYLQDDTVESGEYTIAVDHNRVCQPSTRYTLRVLLGENVIFSEKGDIAEERGRIIERTFTIP